jgi:hypothetical protein
LIATIQVEEPKAVEEVVVPSELQEEPIVLRGFFVSISLPSEGIFQRRFRDKEEIIDQVKKEFDMLRQDLISGFKYLRSQVYSKILPKYTIKIQHVGNRAIYFLPLPNAEPFLREMDTIRREFSTLQMDIDKYLKVDQEQDPEDEEWLKKVERYTKKKGVRGIEPCPNLPSRVQVHLTPLEIHPNQFERFIQDPELQQELSTVGVMLRNDYSETVEKLAQELDARLGEVIERLSRNIKVDGIRKNNIAIAKNMLSELEAMAESANLHSVMADSFKHANLLIEVLMTEDEAYSPRVKQSAKELAQNLGYQVKGNINPSSILAKIGVELEEDTSPRVKALLKEVL